MNYKAHYKKLIEKSKDRIYSGYTESHHILPRCLGGSNDVSNLVDLTPEEHYVAHQLLIRIYPNEPKLVYAAIIMCANRRGNKVYGWLRKRLSAAQKVRQCGELNSQFGLVWIHKNGKAIKIKPEQLTEFTQDGWERGRKPTEIINKKVILRGIHSEKFNWILEQEEIILAEFDMHNSISLILTKRGFKNREGNAILSKWLKSKGKSPLRRRNTAGVA